MSNNLVRNRYLAVVVAGVAAIALDKVAGPCLKGVPNTEVPIAVLKELSEAGKLALPLIGAVFVLEQVLKDYLERIAEEKLAPALQNAFSGLIGSVANGFGDLSRVVGTVLASLRIVELKRESPEQSESKLVSVLPERAASLAREGNVDAAIAQVEAEFSSQEELEGKIVALLILSKKRDDWERAGTLLRDGSTHEPKILPAASLQVLAGSRNAGIN